MGKCITTDAMEIVIECDKESMLQTEHLLGPRILFCSDVGTGVDLIDPFGIGDVDFVRADPDDGSCRDQ